MEPRGGSDATMGLVWVAAGILRSDLRHRYSDELVGPVAKALDWLNRDRARRVRMPGTESADSLAGGQALRQLAVGLVSVGQPEVAELALALAADARGDGADAGDEAVARRLIAEIPATMPGAHLPDVGDRGAQSVPGRPGFDVVEVADLRNHMLNSVVDDAPAGPALFASWRSEWDGHPLEVHRIPTAWGRVAAAVRWHGANPALLWDVQPWFGGTDGASIPVLTAPGLSPGWSATGWSGEVLLSR